MAITVQQILATLGIDSAEASVYSGGQYAIIQRDPQPGEEGILIGTDVDSLIVDLDGDSLLGGSLSGLDFNLYIDGTLVMDNISGVVTWYGSWTGSVSVNTATDPFVFWKINAQQVSGPLFGSEQVVPVQVNILPAVLTVDYDFTCQDLTPPRVIAAEALDEFTTRVTFDDGMALTGAGSVLDILNWPHPGAITRLNEDPDPGVHLEVISVTDAGTGGIIPWNWTYPTETARLAATGFTTDDLGKIAFQESDSTFWQLYDTALLGGGYGYLPYGHFPYGHTPTSVSPAWTEVHVGQQFDLTFQWEMTPDCLYMARAGAAIEDDAGNSMNSYFNFASFSGFSPLHPDGRLFDYWKMFVPLKNREEDATRDLKRFINCFQEVLSLLLLQVDRFPDMYDLDICSDSTIDAMLYDMGNPFEWAELDLTPIQRRKLLRYLITIYKLKGTDQGIEDSVFFLLGEIVDVVDYIQDGWILGIDELGDGSIAEVLSTWEPFNFSILPSDLVVAIDDGFSVAGAIPASSSFSLSGDHVSDFVSGYVFQIIESTGNDGKYTTVGSSYNSSSNQTTVQVAEVVLSSVGDGRTAEVVTLIASDFAVPATATAKEVVTAIYGRLNGGGAYAVGQGSPAKVTFQNPAPFALTGGEILTIDVDGIPNLVTFHASDFATPGVATNDEVATRISTDVPDVLAYIDGLSVSIETKQTGITESLSIPNSGAAPLFFVAPWPKTSQGTDAEHVGIFSNTAGIDASVEVIGGAANTILDFSTDPVGGTGGSILSPDDSYTMYCFDIESQTVLSSEMQMIIRWIADYMKPAHTHLINIRTSPPLPWPEGWVIGVDELDIGTTLMGP